MKILNFNTKIISKTPFITHKTVGNKMHGQCESHPYICICVVEMEGKKFCNASLKTEQNVLELVFFYSFTLLAIPKQPVCEKWSLTAFERFNCILWAFRVYFCFLWMKEKRVQNQRMRMMMMMMKKKISSNISKHSFCIMATYSYIIQVEWRRNAHNEDDEQKKKPKLSRNIPHIYYLSTAPKSFFFYKCGLF